VMTRLQDTSPADLASLKWYTVKRGDTLPLIARKLSVSKTDLAEANYLPGTARVSAGQKLIVPRETTVLLAARAERTVPVADSRTIKTPPALLAQDTTGSDRVKVLYRVQRGDSLASIARLFRTSVAALRSWNKIPGARIAPGARLTIYTARAD
jgi:membrane-bound lytic murein transglycosylase D